MNETQAIIERVRRVNETHQRLALAVEPGILQIKPGQSLLARLTATWDPYLREHWHPVGVEKNLLLVERPGSLRYMPGAVVSLIGPIGSPFRFRKTLRSVLLIAYDTDPSPLLMTLPALIANGISVTLVLLGTAAYGTEHLPPEVEVLRGENGTLNWQNRVTTVGWADQVFITVSPDDEADHLLSLWKMFGDLRADIPSNYLFAVHNMVQPCGVGGCGACTLKIHGGTALVCADGPAFDMTKMVLT
ncbi:MAG: hypothetical protein L6Q98_19670 [Anaerolineae bacterium]|nr:hypothetical protein [Anaerolineae bacterium]NUQ07230.1 hypothetical protein [Anaerolineae bacterium]